MSVVVTFSEHPILQPGSKKLTEHPDENREDTKMVTCWDIPTTSFAKG